MNKKKVTFTIWKEICIYEETTMKHQIWYTDFDYQRFRQDYHMLLYKIMTIHHIPLHAAVALLNKTSITYNKNNFDQNEDNM